MPAQRKTNEATTSRFLEATYGGNCKGVTKGNVTWFVASECDNQDLCNYRVYYKQLGGIPRKAAKRASPYPTPADGIPNVTPVRCRRRQARVVRRGRQIISACCIVSAPAIRRKRDRRSVPPHQAARPLARVPSRRTKGNRRPAAAIDRFPATTMKAGRTPDGSTSPGDAAPVRYDSGCHERDCSQVFRRSRQGARRRSQLRHGRLAPGRHRRDAGRVFLLTITRESPNYLSRA